MNYARSADGSQKMTSSSTPKTALSAAQAMVWIIEKNLFGTPQADSAAQKLCASAPSESASYAYYVTLRDKMLASYNVIIPSFASGILSRVETVKAASLGEAIEQVMDKYHKAEIVLDADDFQEVIIEQEQQRGGR